MSDTRWQRSARGLGYISAGATVALLMIANVNHLYTIITWNSKRKCFTAAGAPRDTTVLCLMFWLTSWTLWLTTATFACWALPKRERSRERRKSFRRPAEKNHDEGGATAEPEQTAPPPRDDDREYSPTATCCVLYQISLPVSVTTAIAYSIAMITNPPSDSLSINHEKCLSVLDSIVDRSAPAASFWLYMDRIFNIVAHYLCAVFLLAWFYVRGKIDYSRWFPLSTIFCILLATAIGLIHTYHAPVYDVDNIWLSGLQATLGNFGVHVLLWIGWTRCIRTNNTIT